MTPKTLVFTMAMVAIALTTRAQPLEFNEVSLFLRGGDDETFIREEVTRRKLVARLTPEQEQVLRRQGASDALLESLRRPNAIMSAQEASAYQSARERRRASSAPALAAANHDRDSVHIFNAAYGQPINLGQFGGPHYEVAFFRFREAGEDIVQPRLIDPVASGTEVTTYISPYTLSTDLLLSPRVKPKRFYPYWEDSITYPEPQIGYTAAMIYQVSRPIPIDRYNPIRVDGVPYALYPVYGGGGVALYYIGQSGDSVKLAVRRLL